MKNKLPEDFRVVRRPPAGYRAKRITEDMRGRLNTKPSQRVGPPPADEREHFYTCEGCGQAVDMRKLGDVFHHEEPEHEPLPAQ